MNKDLRNKESGFLSYLIFCIKGFCMGASDVVPGVSGGTMAFILGIYEELVLAIRSFDLDFIKLLFSFKIKEALEHVSFRFLLSIFIGILIAIFSLARIISWLLENEPVLIWSFFFGLILASVFTVSRYLERWNINIVLYTLLGLASAYFLVGIVPVSTPDHPWFLIMSGAIAICAMILPGISGSFILVILGKYHYVLNAVNTRDFFTLFLVALGACVGLLAFSRLLNWLLTRYHDFTIAILTGLMIGSLRKVWPWKESLQAVNNSGETIPIPSLNILPSELNNEVLLSLFLILIGFLLVLSLWYLSEKK